MSTEERKETMKTGVRGWGASALVSSLLMLAACGDRQSPGSVAQPETGAGTPAGAAPTITYASEPDPPRAGNNAVSVLVRDKDGAPMPDLVVTTTYSMPAMPSMNMPAMRDSFTLTYQGEGKYSGNVHLSMGGTWAVTISASRGAEPVARKLLNIVAKE
jgi:hypothetical protein